MTIAQPVPGGWEPLGHPGPVVSLLAQPAAGADFIVALPTFECVRLLSVTAKLVTAVTVANRHPVIELVDADGNVLVQSSVGTALAASTPGIVSWSVGSVLDGSGSGGYQGPLPNMWLPPGCKAQSAVGDLQAADQWSLVVATFDRRYYAPQYGPTTGD